MLFCDCSELGVLVAIPIAWLSGTDVLHGSHSVSALAVSAGDGQVSSLIVVSLIVGCP